MARYIDADKMLSDICAECLDKGTDECKNGNCTERNWINNTPTEDVQPVVHAKREYNPINFWRCSNCGVVVSILNETDRKKYHKFCSRCGAKMQDVIDFEE